MRFATRRKDGRRDEDAAITIVGMLPPMPSRFRDIGRRRGRLARRLA